MKKSKTVRSDEPEGFSQLKREYTRGQNDMEQRRNRKNGWRDTVKLYMNVIPTPWPFQAKVAEPLVRTTILEKNGRLLNSKLKGRLVPRENGDLVKAKINNALLDYQWDRADTGGSMLEKIAKADLNCRLFGASFAWVYWDTVKDCNEVKIIDNQDVLLDPTLEHIRGAHDDQWVMIREWLTASNLKKMGFDASSLEEKIDQKDASYEPIVKDIRGLDEPGKEEGLIEVVHKVQNKTVTTFLPRHKVILKTVDNKLKRIHVAMLRYYPVPEDIYGESEVEPVMGIARTVNWTLSGFMEEGNIMMHPPTIVPEVGVRRETIAHVPGAIWIANNPDLIRREIPGGNGIIGAFNNVYPMLKNAFNTAMGSQSLGVSAQQGGKMDDKTATEVRALNQQQSTRDQYNQLYLGEFLKDIMMMWQGFNKIFLFDDPTKKHHILRVIGQDMLKQFQQMGLGEYDVPPEAMNEITAMMEENPQAYNDQQMQGMVDQVKQPTFPVVTNPEAEPEEYNVVPKLNMLSDDEADLYLQPEDMEGLYDFIPDVISMGAGASAEQKAERRQTFELLTSPEARQNLMEDGYRLKAKEIYSTLLADSKYDSPENYFEKLPSSPPNIASGANVPNIGAQMQPPLANGQNMVKMSPVGMPPMGG